MRSFLFAKAMLDAALKRELDAGRRGNAESCERAIALLELHEQFEPIEGGPDDSERAPAGR